MPSCIGLTPSLRPAGPSVRPLGSRPCDHPNARRAAPLGRRRWQRVRRTTSLLHAGAAAAASRPAPARWALLRERSGDGSACWCLSLLRPPRNRGRCTTSTREPASSRGRSWRGRSRPGRGRWWWRLSAARPGGAPGPLVKWDSSQHLSSPPADSAKPRFGVRCPYDPAAIARELESLLRQTLSRSGGSAWCATLVTSHRSPPGQQTALTASPANRARSRVTVSRRTPPALTSALRWRLMGIANCTLFVTGSGGSAGGGPPNKCARACVHSAAPPRTRPFARS